MIANFEQYSSVLSVVSKGFSMLGCLIYWKYSLGFSFYFPFQQIFQEIIFRNPSYISNYSFFLIVESSSYS